MEQFDIDTLMKQQDYKLLQKEIDSVSSLYYYSNLQQIKDGPAWVRSVSVMEATLNNFKSRMIRYRTYSKEEYQSLLAAMLAEGYRTVNKTELGKDTQVIYDNGSLPVRITEKIHTLDNGRILKSYELEIGK